MSSIGESLDIIGQLLYNDGVYLRDPQALELSSYVNNWGKTTFHVAMIPEEIKSLYLSPYCREIKKLWDRNGITDEGQKVLDRYLSPRKLGES